MDSRCDGQALGSRPALPDGPYRLVQQRAHLPRASVPSPKPPTVIRPLAAVECCHTGRCPPAWPRGCPERICSGSGTAGMWRRGSDSHCCRECRSISCRGRAQRNSFASNCHGLCESPGNPSSGCWGTLACVLERKGGKKSNVLIHEHE